jgi:hypothetical protein
MNVQNHIYTSIGRERRFLAFRLSELTRDPEICTNAHVFLRVPGGRRRQGQTPSSSDTKISSSSTLPCPQHLKPSPPPNANVTLAGSPLRPNSARCTPHRARTPLPQAPPNLPEPAAAAGGAPSLAHGGAVAVTTSGGERAHPRV